MAGHSIIDTPIRTCYYEDKLQPEYGNENRFLKSRNAALKIRIDHSNIHFADIISGMTEGTV